MQAQPWLHMALDCEHEHTPRHVTTPWADRLEQGGQLLLLLLAVWLLLLLAVWLLLLVVGARAEREREQERERARRVRSCGSLACCHEPHGVHGHPRGVLLQRRIEFGT
jgi:hypothetical protein